MASFGDGSPLATIGMTHPQDIIKLKYRNMVKLDQTNLFSWKLLVMTHIRGYQLLYYIEAPIDVTNDLCVQQDQLLLGWLFSTITSSILTKVTWLKTSFEVWRSLQEIFGANSISQVLQLRNKLQNF